MLDQRIIAGLLLIQGFDMFVGSYQDMCRASRMDIAERRGPLISIYDAGIGLIADDLAEYARLRAH